MFKDFLIAGRIERTGNGYFANLAGVGGSFRLGAKALAGFEIYIRKDNFNSFTYQLSPYWYVPFNVGRFGFLFTGYLDLSGTDHYGADINTEPQFLFDIGGAVSGHDNSIFTGLAWQVHRNDVELTSVPQVAFRWIF